MILTVRERIMVLNSLPEQGNILLLRVRQDLIGKIGLSEAEMGKYGFQQEETGRAVWRIDVPQEAEIALSDTEAKIIKESLQRLDREQKLTPDHVSIYEKFVEEK